MDKLTSSVTDLATSDVNERMFWLLAIIILGFFINMIIGTWKGRDPYTIQLWDRLVDAIKYLFSEMVGDVTQKINALFSISVFVFLIGSIVFLFVDYVGKPVLNKDLIVLSIVLVIILCLAMPICTHYTRPRY